MRPLFSACVLQDLEDQLLLAQPRRARHAQILGDLVELLDAHVLELDQVQRSAAVLLLRGHTPAVTGPFAMRAMLVLWPALRAAVGLTRLGALAVGNPGFRRLSVSRSGLYPPSLGRLWFGGLRLGYFLFNWSGIRHSALLLIFQIACQISLAPRHSMAENGSSSPEASFRRAAIP